MRRFLIGLGILVSTHALAGEPVAFEFRGLTVESTSAGSADILQKCEAYFNSQGCKLVDAHVAGTLSFPQAMFANSTGKMEELRGTVYGDSYETIRAGFIQKWGEPTSYVEESVQNGYGATKKIPVSVWKFADGELTLIGTDFRGDGEWHFRTFARQAYLDGLKKPKADF